MRASLCLVSEKEYHRTNWCCAVSRFFEVFLWLLSKNGIRGTVQCFMRKLDFLIFEISNDWGITLA